MPKNVEKKAHKKESVHLNSKTLKQKFIDQSPTLQLLDHSPAKVNKLRMKNIISMNEKIQKRIMENSSKG